MSSSEKTAGEKRPYETPTLTREGGLLDVTAGGVTPGIDVAMTLLNPS